MKAGFLCQRIGLHEERFLRVFKNHNVQLEPIIINSWSQLKTGEQKTFYESLKFVLGGPIHLNHEIPDLYKHLPFIALSYAYDVLYESNVNKFASENVRKNLFLSSGLIVDCQVVKKIVEQKFQYKKPILVAPWGLEKLSLDKHWKITSRESDRFKNSKKILSVRNLTHLHGVLDVVRGFSEAVKNNSNLYLTIAGDGPLRKDLFNLIDKLDVKNKVEFLGFQTEAQVNLLMLESDIYVSASKVDGTSVSLLQALEARLPVILSNCGGNLEWANRVEGAYLFEVGDWKVLGELMNQNNMVEKFDRSLVINEFANWVSNGRLIVDFCRSFI